MQGSRTDHDMKDHGDSKRCKDHRQNKQYNRSSTAIETTKYISLSKLIQYTTYFLYFKLYFKGAKIFCPVKKKRQQKS